MVEPVLVFAILWCSSLSILLVFRTLVRFKRALRRGHLCITKWLAYSYLWKSHQYIDSATVARVALTMTYIGLNIFCLTFRVASLPAAALRAGDLALLNQFPLILHFAPILFADYRILVLRIHSAAGFMSLSHILLHVVSFIAGRGDFNFNKHLYAYSVRPTFIFFW